MRLIFDNLSDQLEENLMVAVSPSDGDDLWEQAHQVNDSSILWINGQLDTESYLDQFAEFGNVDYHVERMTKIWEHWRLI